MSRDNGWKHLFPEDDENKTGSYFDEDGCWGYKNADGSWSHYDADGSWGHGDSFDFIRDFVTSPQYLLHGGDNGDFYSML